jgi:hypothetical protein
MVWDYYEQNVLHLERPYHLMSFAYKWLGEQKTYGYILPDFPLYKREPFNDSALMEQMWLVYCEADVIIWHNGDRFDQKKSFTRFLAPTSKNPKPPSPFRTIDTLKEARKIGHFPSNKLGALCDFFGFPGKIKTGGFDLWLACIKGDMVAWEKMRRYNKQDVRANEWVYTHLAPWMRNHPNLYLNSGVPYACPVCGSSKTKSDPNHWTYAKTYRSKRYVCLNCGKWSQGQRVRIEVPVLT